MASGNDEKQEQQSSAKTTLNGYDLDIFCSNLHKKFLCYVCKLVLRNPVQTFCGHRFCEHCFQDIIINSEKEGVTICPLCKDEDGEISKLKQENIFPDKAISRELSKLDSKCLNHGCEWKGRFGEFQHHSECCEYKYVQCKCGQRLTKASLIEHEMSSCELRGTVCRHCKLKTVFKEMDVHLRLCPKRPSICDMCELSLPHDSLASHRHPKNGDCVFVKCKFGCHDKVERQKVQEHDRTLNDKHLSFLLRELEATKMKYRTDVTDIKTRLEEIEGRCASSRLQLPGSENATGCSNSTAPVDIERRILNIEEKVAHIEKVSQVSNNIIGVLHRESTKNADSLTSIHSQDEEYKEAIENKIRGLERSLLLKDLTIKEQNNKIEQLETSSFDGILVWKITNFSKKREEAKNGFSPSIYSPPFWSSRAGYKMCARLYLNGDGSGRGTHISIYFQLLLGEHDAILSWPFTVDNVQFWVMDQNERRKENFIDAFRPDPKHPACKRPTTSANPAVGCPELMALALLEERARKYVCNDTMFIKIVVKDKK